jgi:2-keto-4-pentenoate hydratase/2-oxohepta-3-ene-1,7-dioic acid hydratase in catechol pathway
VNSWSLVTYRTASGEERAGAFHERRVVELPIAACGALELIERWSEVEPVLKTFDPAEAAEVAGAELALPLRYPHKVLCSGTNYYGHMREMGVKRSEGARPYFFLKPPTTALIGPGQAIVVPADPGAKVDWEAELAVVIGRRGRHIKESEALSYVAGYSAINDVSLRGPHRVQNPIGEPFQWDWLASKGADQSTPLGPGIRPAFLVEDPQRLDLRLWVNGHLKQEANTSDMIDGVAALVAAASEILTLEPGDVIATGTPHGVGLPRGEFLRPGDLVEMEVADFGRLSNPVIGEGA